MNINIPKICKHLPCDTIKVTSFYGYRTHPVTGVENTFHSGADIGCNGNLYASFNGKVISVYTNKYRGNVLIIQYEKKINNKYVRFLAQHLKDNSIKVKEGDKVKAGQIIGQIGTTGSSTGVHLHFEVHLSEDEKTWKIVDPLMLLINFTTMPITRTLSIDTNTGYILEVARLQQLLNTYTECKLVEDGRFGDNTRYAVKEFQNKYNLKIDGIFGPECLAKLTEINKNQTPNISRLKGK